MKKTLLFLLFISISISLKAQREDFTRIDDLEQIVLKGKFFSAKEFAELKKQIALNLTTTVETNPEDSIALGKDYILLKPDGTFAYKLILEIHLNNGEVGLLKLPFNNVSPHYTDIHKNFQVDAKTGTWSFQIKLVPRGFHRSDLLIVPKDDENYNYIYTFTSNDKGREWEISLKREKRN